MILSELADIQMGYPFRSRLEHEPDGDVAVIQMKDLVGERMDAVPPDLVRVNLAGRAGRYLLRPGDILFRSRGQTNTAVLIAVDLGQALIAAPLMSLRAKSAAVRPDYLAWCINQPASQAYLRTELRGTSVQMISTESLGQLDVVVPSLQRQAAIVELAELGTREQQLMSQTAQLRQRYLQHNLWQYAHHDRARDP